jgi:hypothetical protein
MRSPVPRPNAAQTADLIRCPMHSKPRLPQMTLPTIETIQVSCPSSMLSCCCIRWLKQTQVTTCAVDYMQGQSKLCGALDVGPTSQRMKQHQLVRLQQRQTHLPRMTLPTIETIQASCPSSMHSCCFAGPSRDDNVVACKITHCNMSCNISSDRAAANVCEERLCTVCCEAE